MAVEARATEDRWTSTQRTVAVASVVVGVVLRWWALGSARLSFDEAFTGAYADLPLGQIPGALRANDSHPPLDYVLRHWVSGQHSEFWLRAPSAVFATAALVVVAWWMRRRGWFGVAVVVLFALAPFQLLYGRQARMYALMCLIGVLLAVIAERWLKGQGERRLAVAVAALLVVACLDHAGGLLLAGGVFLVPGLRRDRAAWEWRGAVVGAVAVWAVLWGPSFLEQADGGHGLWIPHTDLTSADGLVNGMVSLLEGTFGLVTALTLLGGAALLATRPRLARIWGALFLVPLALVVLAGLRYRIVIPRTLAGSSWAVPVAWAAAGEWVLRRSRPIAAVLVAVMALLWVRSLPTAMGFDEGTGTPALAARDAVQPGDGLLVHPNWLWPLAWWNLDTDRGSDLPPAMADVDGWYWVRPGAEPTGRTWVLEPISYHLDTSRWPSCAPFEQVGDEWELGCVVTGGS